MPPARPALSSSRSRWRLTAVLCGGALGCAPPMSTLRDTPAQGTSPQTRAERENEAALQELLDRARAGGVGAAPTEPPGAGLEVVVVPLRPQGLRDDGSLSRTSVEAFVGRGAHAVLGVVDVIPARGAGGEVLGFRLDRFRDGSAPLSAVGFAEGDIVTRVNGRSVLLPEAFIDVWNEIPTLPALEVQILRADAGGSLRELVLSWPITT